MEKSFDKKTARQRRGLRTRMKIRQLGAYRLCIHRTLSHMYAQITTANGDRTLAAASTLETHIATDLKSTSNIEAAQQVGKTIAERAKQVGITAVAFDRSGFKYHGRVKALADAAREHGLQF